ELQQHQAALARSGVLPRLEGFRRRVDGPIDVLLGSLRDAAERLLVDGADDGLVLPVHRGDQLAIDEILVGLHGKSFLRLPQAPNSKFSSARASLRLDLR